MKAKIRNKNQSINIEIDIENSIFSKNKMRMVSDKNKQNEELPAQAARQPVALFNANLPDEINMYNAIIASRKLYELSMNREPNMFPMQQTVPRPQVVQQAPRPAAQQAPRPATQQAAQTVAQAPQQAAQAPQTPAQQTGPRPPFTSALMGNLTTPAVQPSPAAALTVQGSPMIPVPRYQSPPRQQPSLFTSATPAYTSPAAITTHTLPSQQPNPGLINLPSNQQPSTTSQQLQFELEPLVNLNLPNDEPVQGYRRPLTKAEEEKFVSLLPPDKQAKRQAHVNGLITGTKSAHTKTIKKYRLEKYVQNLANKFGYSST